MQVLFLFTAKFFENLKRLAWDSASFELLVRIEFDPRASLHPGYIPEYVRMCVIVC